MGALLVPHRILRRASRQTQDDSGESDRVQRLLDGLGIRHIDAKGRPQCKLVENFFNRLWSVLSLVPGQVGRYQAENKAMSEKYVACRNGRQDPRGIFPTLAEALEAIDWAVNYLNTHPVESRESAMGCFPRTQGCLFKRVAPGCQGSGSPL